MINDPGDLGCKRSLEHLEELSAKARACNARLMDAVIAGQGSGILANPVIERIAHPTSDEAGRRVPAMRFADPRVQALAGCLAVWDFAVNGITNKRLRAWMTGLRGSPLHHEPGLLRPGQAAPQRADRTDRPQQHLPADRRRAHLRPGLQPRPRPGPLPPDRARPADRSARPDPGRLACHHPAYRQHHRRRPPRTRGLNPCPAGLRPAPTQNSRQPSKFSGLRALAHQISLVDLQGPAFADLRGVASQTAQRLLRLAQSSGLPRFPLNQMRTALRRALGTWSLDAESEDDSYEAARERAATMTIGDDQDSERLPPGDLAGIAAGLGEDLTDKLVLGFPQGPFILVLQPDNPDTFDAFLNESAAEINVNIRYSSGTGVGGEWVIVPQPKREDLGVRFGVPPLLESWLLAEDDVDRERVRLAKKMFFSSIAVFHHGNRLTQLRYRKVSLATANGRRGIRRAGSCAAPGTCRTKPCVQGASGTS